MTLKKARDEKKDPEKLAAKVVDAANDVLVGHQIKYWRKDQGETKKKTVRLVKVMIEFHII